MFTGIIQATGELLEHSIAAGGGELSIDTSSLDMNDVAVGDSIAVNGVCLTVTGFADNCFKADVSNETLSCTTLGQLPAGSIVNLEKALLPTSRLGGHLVSGHVDGIGELVSREDDGRSERFVFRVPTSIKKYVATKGSICIDGISLTVNDVNINEFGVNVVPHTSSQTNMDTLIPGIQVNLEVDVIARYLERMISSSIEDDSEGISEGNTVASDNNGISLQVLRDCGYL